MIDYVSMVCIGLAASLLWCAWCVVVARIAEDPLLAPWSRGAWQRLGLRGNAEERAALVMMLAVITETRDEDFFADFDAFVEAQAEPSEEASPLAQEDAAEEAAPLARA